MGHGVSGLFETVAVKLIRASRRMADIGVHLFFKDKSLHVDLVLHPEFQCLQSGQSFRKLPCFRLVNIPDAFLFIMKHGCQVFCAVCPAGPQFHIIGIIVQRENVRCDCIRSCLTEVNAAESDHAFPVPVKSYPLFISRTDISFVKVVQSGGNIGERIQGGITGTFRNEFHLADEFTSAVLTSAQSPQVILPVPFCAYSYPVIFPGDFYIRGCNSRRVGHFPGNGHVACIRRQDAVFKGTFRILLCQPGTADGPDFQPACRNTACERLFSSFLNA